MDATLIQALNIEHLFHFTDARNIPSIREHGLLSWRELQRRGIVPVAPGGNDWSHVADERCGLDDYVHLCFLNEHPMEYVASQSKRIERAVYLQVSARVLESGGVLASDDVSNKAGVEPFPLAEAGRRLDLEVIYKRTDWKNKQVQERRQAAKKYEVLVPKQVHVSLIAFPK